VDDKAQDNAEAARAQARRDRLRVLMDRLEVALPEPTRRDPDRWRDQVLVVAADLEAGLIDHVAETEARGGLFDDVTRHAPRLTNRIGELRNDHPALLDVLGELRAMLDQSVQSDETVAAARRQGLTVLGQLVQHRQLGADLLYEAYWVDVPSGN
jgi:hypothetical protein